MCSCGSSGARSPICVVVDRSAFHSSAYHLMLRSTIGRSVRTPTRSMHITFSLLVSCCCRMSFKFQREFTSASPYHNPPIFQPTPIPPDPITFFFPPLFWHAFCDTSTRILTKRRTRIVRRSEASRTNLVYIYIYTYIGSPQKRKDTT